MKQISPSLAYVERENPSGGIFTSTRFLARLVRCVINIHNNIMYGYINMVEVKLIDEGKAADDGTHGEIHANNTVKVRRSSSVPSRSNSLPKLL